MTLAREFGYEVRETMIPRDLLYVADEIFMTGTAAEITPVRSVDHIAVGAGRRGPLTTRLQEEFFALVMGQKPDRYAWLTHVNK
jgi:branched-chain amino acid aminotransferase